MPRPRSYANGFTAKELSAITGLSRPMVDYLRRAGYLTPSYDGGAQARGKVRYYSYRDLVVGRIVQRLRESGIELARLKLALFEISNDKRWDSTELGAQVLRLLVTDGQTMFLSGDDGFLEQINSGGQRVFSFVVNVNQIKTEVYDLIPKPKQTEFSMKNEPLREIS